MRENIIYSVMPFNNSSANVSAISRITLDALIKTKLFQFKL